MVRWRGFFLMFWGVHRIGLVSAVGLLLLHPPVYALSIHGVAWVDSDRDGQRSAHEPRLPGITALLLGVGPTTNDFATVTDAQGAYVFSGMPAGQYQLYVSPPSGYGITTKGSGPDADVDSDLVLFSYFPPTSGRTATFVFNGTAITNLDAGFSLLQSGLSAQAVTQGEFTSPLFVTSGTVVARSCIISNSGETSLSFVSVYDQSLDQEVGTLDCPGLLAEGHVIGFTDSFIATASMTSTLSVVALPINPITCESLDLDPLSVTTQTVVIVVRPESASDYDGDGVTDWEEFVSGTDGGDAASRWAIDLAPGTVTITLSATSRLYRVYATTNMADEASWLAVDVEQSGTGGALPFSITNLPATAVYRATARMP